MHRHKSSLLLCLALSCALLLTSAAPAFAASRREYERHRDAARRARRAAADQEEKAGDLIRATKKLEDQMEALEKQISALEGDISTSTERRERLDREIDLLRSDIAIKETQIQAVQDDYDLQTNALAERMDAQYRAGDWAYLQLILSSEDLIDLIDRTATVQQIMASDLAIAESLEGAKIDLEKVKSEVERDLSTVNTKRREALAEEEQLKQLQASRNVAFGERAAARSQKKSLLSETRQNIRNLEAQARAEEAESSRIAAELGRSGSRGGGHYGGQLSWPTPGHSRVSSNYGWRMHPILHRRRMHTGIDIAAPSGARVIAAGDGRVVYAGWRGGYGKCVMIDHGDGLVSLYAHMSSISTRVGAHKTAGSRIGSVGSTGMSTGAHLHFETRVNGSPRNPMNYL